LTSTSPGRRNTESPHRQALDVVRNFMMTERLRNIN
jgi:hypothetical protein